MKHKAHQPDFQWGAEDFALVAESAPDHERRQREAEQARQDREESDRQRQASLPLS